MARQVVASGDAEEVERVATDVVEALRAPDLRIALVFADWRFDPHVVARATQRGLAPAQVVGATTAGVIASAAKPAPAVLSIAGLGLYGDWLRVGIGVAAELPASALTRSRDAVQYAAVALGSSAAALDGARHVGLTLVDGRCGHEEGFCIGSAAAAPQIRMVGGCASTEVASARRPYVFANGEVLGDAGIVVLLDSELPFHAVSSAHLVATEIKTVVTAASGRVIEELDGRPAGARLRELVRRLGDELDAPRPARYSFARYVGGMPYVRSITHLEGDRIVLASGVEPGHVLRVMRPGDLIATTARDLAHAAERLGGSLAAMLAFSCVGRHWEAASTGVERELAGAYAAHPTVGLQTFGEQTGMLLVNHTLTGLAIGAVR